MRKEETTMEKCYKITNVDKYQTAMNFINLSCQFENMFLGLFLNQKKLYYYIYEVISNKNKTNFTLKEELRDYIFKKYYKYIKHIKER